MAIIFQSLMPKEMPPNTPLATSIPSSQPPSQTMGETAIILPRRPIPEFLFQLTQMLSDPANHKLIEWSGRRVVVHDPVSLEKEVLQKYFRHSKYSSFQRQMNYFGFRKNAGKGRMSPCTYENDSVSDDLSSLLFIKRKTQGAATISKKSINTMKKTQELTSVISDDESHEMPKTPLSLTPDVCTSRAMPKTKALDNVPFVVTAEEYGAPGTMQFPAATPSTVTPPPFLSSETFAGPPSHMPLPCSSLDASMPMPNAVLSMNAGPLSQPSVVRSSPQPRADVMFAHHQHNVPNPLLSLSSQCQPLPCPSNPATAAVEASASNNPQEGSGVDLSSHLIPDLTLGFLNAPSPVVPNHSNSPVESLTTSLTTRLPSSNTLFGSSSEVSTLDGIESNDLSLSPSSSLVDLAMLPTNTVL